MVAFSIRRDMPAMVALTCLAYLPSLGCEGQPYPIPDSDTLARDSHYMASIFDRRTNGQPFAQVVLSDERQYQALVHRLLVSGNTPENSPELFARLEEDRLTALGSTPPSSNTVGTAVAALTGPTWCGHILPTYELIAPGVSYFKANPQVSCWQGAEYVYADVSGYASNYDETSMDYLSSNAGEQYATGTDFSNVIIEPSITAGEVKNKFFADSYVIAYNTPTGNSQYTYTAVRTTIGAAPDNTNSPAYKPMGPPQATPLDCLTNIHPRDLINDPSTTSDDGRTRICLERGIVSGNLDCDYSTVDNNFNPVWVNAPAIRGIAGINASASKASMPPKWIAQTTPPTNESLSLDWPAAPVIYDTSKMYIPLRGRYDATKAAGANFTNCKIKSYVTNSTTASLFLIESGGWCPGGSTGGSLAGTTNITGGFPTVTGMQGISQLNLLGNFGPDCVGNQKSTKLFVQIATKLECTNQKQQQQQVDKTCIVNISPLDFKNSCFAEGTEILRADGTRDEVENIKVGDKVLSSDSGRAITVVSIARGGERHPLVNLYDADGHDLMLTEKHPVVTANKGIVFADQVTEGDLVRTERGVSPIVAISRIPYHREVFNLSIGTPEELATIREEERTMFAGGILVGDGAMQWEMESKPKPLVGDTLSRLPAAWRKDYFNDVARGATADK